MLRKNGTTFVLALLVAVALLGAAIPGEAAGPQRTHAAAAAAWEAGLWERLLAWIRISSAGSDPRAAAPRKTSWAIDPNGQPVPTADPDYSWAIDPNG